MTSLKVNKQIPINHPLSDSISVQDSSFHYSNDTCSELAFFKGGKWVLEVIPEFKGYENNFHTGTMVYPLVPNDLIEAFLEQYRA